ncbi:response regulator [Paenibacillus sp. EKM208P]|nr:response regulator [Paenibacillus sp. EKM208P]
MQNQKVLIVDDENGIILMLEMALRKEGYTMIRRALTGGEALEAVRITAFDFFVLDVMLPDTDG